MIMKNIGMMMKISFSLKAIRSYLYRVGVAIDILFNVILGGHVNQTFSARNWHWKKQGKPNLVWLIDMIIFWDHPHCMNSWLYWHTKVNVRKIAKPQVEYIKIPRETDELL